jgi:hypothetical protein
MIKNLNLQQIYSSMQSVDVRIIRVIRFSVQKIQDISHTIAIILKYMYNTVDWQIMINTIMDVFDSFNSLRMESMTRIIFM